MRLQLIDDGTLDTVVRCVDCGEEFRYGHEFIVELLDEGENEVPDHVRVGQALAFAQEDHNETGCEPKA